MKQIAIGILVSVLFIGCERPEPTGEQKTTTRVKSTHGIEILTIDSCQYIRAIEPGVSGTMSVSIIHKANCPNHTTETK